MPFCPQCGVELDDGDSYCFECGTEVERRMDEPEDSEEGSNRQNRQEKPSPERSARIEPRRKQRVRRPPQTKQNRQHQSSNAGLIAVVQVLGIISAVVLLAGVFMPWFQIEISSMFGQTTLETYAGTEFRAGIIVLGLAAGGGLMMVPQHEITHALAGVAGFFAIMLLLLQRQDPLFMMGESDELTQIIANGTMAPTAGITVCLIGAVGLTVLGFGGVIANSES